MGESLTEQYRVRDDCLWVVNLFFQGGINDVYLKNKHRLTPPFGTESETPRPPPRAPARALRAPRGGHTHIYTRPIQL